MSKRAKPPSEKISILDLNQFHDSVQGRTAFVESLRLACRANGFFYLIGHGISEELQQRLEIQSAEFFALKDDEKMAIAMAKAGRAWRGYFPLGAELTSGVPDLKEGLYFGTELPSDHPKVQAGIPLHGSNLFPAILGFKSTVLEYLTAMKNLGDILMSALSLSLNLDESYFHSHYTYDPLILFRIFHYPPQPNMAVDAWGVGEHTDYGLLTMLKQDDCGGLEVKSGGVWIPAPPIAGSFVCNIGDMLDRLTKGLYRSTPHRVRNISGRHRYSFPLFFDPCFDSKITPLPLSFDVIDDQNERWDKKSVHAFDGTYGDYILSKVGKVFPELHAKNVAE